MIWDIFVIIFSVTAVSCLYLVTMYKRDRKKYDEYKENEQRELEYKRAITPKFNVSEYMERTEKAFLEILETKHPINQSITLWWGLNGLRLNEDGTTEWVSRKKPKPLPDVWSMSQTTTPIMCKIIGDPIRTDMQQAPQDEIAALKKQLNVMELNEAMQHHMSIISTSLQSNVTPYPSYLECGHMYFERQIEQCCCNRLL